MGLKLYVGNLAFSATEESITEIFSKHGTVDSCHVICDKVTGRSKGFGFVEMSNSDDAKKAISSLDGHEIDGRALRVNEARPMEKRSSSGFHNSGFGGGQRRGGGTSY